MLLKIFFFFFWLNRYQHSGKDLASNFKKKSQKKTFFLRKVFCVYRVFGIFFVLLRLLLLSQIILFSYSVFIQSGWKEGEKIFPLLLENIEKNASSYSMIYDSLSLRKKIGQQKLPFVISNISNGIFFSSKKFF